MWFRARYSYSLRLLLLAVTFVCVGMAVASGLRARRFAEDRASLEREVDELAKEFTHSAANTAVRLSRPFITSRDHDAYIRLSRYPELHDNIVDEVFWDVWKFASTVEVAGHTHPAFDLRSEESPCRECQRRLPELDLFWRSRALLADIQRLRTKAHDIASRRELSDSQQELMALKTRVQYEGARQRLPSSGELPVDRLLAIALQNARPHYLSAEEAERVRQRLDEGQPLMALNQIRQYVRRHVDAELGLKGVPHNPAARAEVFRRHGWMRLLFQRDTTESSSRL